MPLARVNAMTEAEAYQGRVGDRRGYFKATDGKSKCAAWIG
jgi:hypothetical protein